MLRSMFHKFLASPASDQEKIESQTTGLRVAVPTFGLPGIRVVEDVIECDRTTRSEIEELFAAELARELPVVSAPSENYTKGERYEMVVTALLRTALYDDKEAA